MLLHHRTLTSRLRKDKEYVDRVLPPPAPLSLPLSVRQLNEAVPSCDDLRVAKKQKKACDDSQKPQTNMKQFLDLPPELRLEIYKLLLVSDCSFRLGHHGPYCHDKSRKRIYPKILRASKAIYHEARDVLYGENTFYVGPLNHKPTYSSSFLTSVGWQNARLIKKVVIHSPSAGVLSKTTISRWLSAQGLDVASLKVVAISLSPPPLDQLVPPIPHHPVQTLPSNLSSLALPPPTTLPPPAPLLAVPPDLTDSDTHELLCANSWLHTAAQASDGWLEVLDRAAVDRLVAVPNSDLRAGDFWLVFVHPAVKRARRRATLAAARDASADAANRSQATADELGRNGRRFVID